MAIIITNNSHYVNFNDSNGIEIVDKITKAYQFESINKAIEAMKRAPGRTKTFYVYDTSTQKILWRMLSEEELEKIRAEKRAKRNIKKTASGKIKRKNYSPDVKKLLYIQADGRCALCGRQILLEDATLDHIIPLAKGGIDSVENLQICCKADNLFKGAIKPEEFNDRISQIFIYQTEKKIKNPVKRLMVHRMLMECAK